MISHEFLIAINNLLLNPKRIDSTGVCFGLSSKYLDALFSKDRATFYKRLAFIENYKEHPEHLVHEVQSIYEKLKKTKPRDPNFSEKELLLLEIRPFFENITLQLHPNFFPEFYNRRDMQNYVLNHALSAPIILENYKPHLIDRSYHAKTERELVKYFDQLKQGLHASKQIIGFIIESDKHAIALSYSLDSEKWELLNADSLIQNRKTGAYHTELNSLQLARTLNESFRPQIDDEELEDEEQELSEYTVFSLCCFGLTEEPVLTQWLKSLCPPYNEDIVTRMNDEQVSIFHLAAGHGDVDALEAMLHLLSDIDATRVDGETALSMAVQEGHLNAIKWLIRNGADAKQTNDSGETLLHIASAMGHSEIVKHLLSIGLLVNAEDSLNCTPLVRAIMSDHHDTALALMKQGANVNHINKEERMPPLFYAVWKGNPKLIIALINAGADVNFKNENGDTALDLAESMSHLDAANILKSFLSLKKKDYIFDPLSRRMYRTMLEEYIRTISNSFSFDQGQRKAAFFERCLVPANPQRPLDNSFLNNRSMITFEPQKLAQCSVSGA